jgi:hypothetical protein
MSSRDPEGVSRPPRGYLSRRRATVFYWLMFMGGVSGNMVLGQDEAMHAYRSPSPAILDVLHAPPTPRLSLSPRRDRLLLIDEQRYPPISDLAQPMLPLAGVRINPRTNGPHRTPRLTGFTLQPLSAGDEIRVELPPDGNFGIPRWSPRGTWFAFSRTIDDRIELWVADAERGEVQKVPGVRLNAAYGDEIQWMPDDQTLLVSLIPDQIEGRSPSRRSVPGGPVVQETKGNAGPVRTYQDLLKSPHDERYWNITSPASWPWSTSMNYK